MLYFVQNNCPVAVQPQLSRVWIKTGNPRMPLKSVWIDNAKLNRFGSEACCTGYEPELAEDHLVPAA